MEITEFLLARIAEDESRVGGLQSALIGEPLRARLLAECGSKRQIMQYAADVQADVVRLTDHIPYVKVRVEASILHLLVQPYADHPDFDPEWRP